MSNNMLLFAVSQYDLPVSVYLKKINGNTLIQPGMKPPTSTCSDKQSTWPVIQLSPVSENQVAGFS